MIYCLSCKRNTSDLNGSHSKSKNGRMMMKCSCGVCKGKKCQFVKSSGATRAKGKGSQKGQTADGLFGDILGTILPIAGTIGGAYLGSPMTGNMLGNVGSQLASKIPF